MSSTNRIEKKLLLRAPKARVWRAIADASEFGQWFGMKLNGGFAVGRTIVGRLTGRSYEHLTVELTVERMDAEDLFSYRWHPYAIDPATDYSTEPTTLVEFRLEETADGTMLTVTESGFEHIPLHRRDEAFRMNDKGWAAQVQNIRRHVEG
jgi:uncharacterized protein YndB with AHSA1/START domain